MDTQYDDRTPTPPTGTLSRRTALRGLGGAGLAIGLGLAARPAAADRDRAAPPVAAAPPSGVVAACVAAVNAGDLAGILAQYADDAVHVALPTPDGSAGVCRG